MFSFGLLVNVIIWGFVIIALVVLIIKRTKEKRHEDFEHRNN